MPSELPTKIPRVSEANHIPEDEIGQSYTGKRAGRSHLNFDPGISSVYVRQPRTRFLKLVTSFSLNWSKTGTSFSRGNWLKLVYFNQFRPVFADHGRFWCRRSFDIYAHLRFSRFPCVLWVC